MEREGGRGAAGKGSLSTCHVCTSPSDYCCIHGMAPLASCVPGASKRIRLLYKPEQSPPESVKWSRTSSRTASSLSDRGWMENEIGIDRYADKTGGHRRPLIRCAYARSRMKREDRPGAAPVDRERLRLQSTELNQHKREPFRNKNEQVHSFPAYVTLSSPSMSLDYNADENEHPKVLSSRRNAS